MRLIAYLTEGLVGLLVVPCAWLRRLVPAPSAKVVVQGWYGSETIGDVAILGQILREWQTVLPQATLMVASFEPQITRRTLAELGRREVRLLRTGAASAWHQATADYTVFGGGPLMESRSMPFWALRALLVRLAGGRTVVYGCGIGPLRGRLCRTSVGWILRLANLVLLRDRRSADFYPRLFERRPPHITFDPAFDFVRDLRPTQADPRPGSAPVLALLLRHPPPVFLDSGETRDVHFVPLLATALNHLARERDARFVGLVMHGDFPESDDSRLYRELAQEIEDPGRLQVPEGYQSLERILASLAVATAALSVRFHGMVFCLALGKPFLAIDYTVPRGKTSAAAETVGVAESVMGWRHLEPDALAARLDDLLIEAQAGASPRGLSNGGFADERIAILQGLIAPTKRRAGSHST